MATVLSVEDALRAPEPTPAELTRRQAAMRAFLATGKRIGRRSGEFSDADLRQLLGRDGDFDGRDVGAK